MSSQCGMGCGVCFNESTCMSCLFGYVLTNYSCTSQCPPRQYMNNHTQCTPCLYDCLTCNAGGCLSCNDTTDHRKLNATNQRCSPQEGYFESNVTVASPCPTGCLSCESTSKCFNCKTGYFLMANFLCSTSCPQRYFGDAASLTCQRCYYDCLLCLNSTGCQSCDPTNDHRQLDSNTSRCLPSLGFF